MKAPCVISPGVVIEDFSSTAAWTADSQIQALVPHWRCVDDLDKRGVVLRAKITSTAMGWITKTGLSLDLSDLAALRLDYNVPSTRSGAYLAYARLTIECSSTGDFAAKKMSAISGYLLPGPNRMTVGAAEFTATGGESWANAMVSFRIGLTCIMGYGDGAAPNYTTTPHVLLDKIVKNPQNTPLLMLAIDPTLWADLQMFQSALSDYGLLGKAHTTIIDYDNVGDATYTTYAQLKAASDAGLIMMPCETAWLLRAPYNAVRPVPPYPAYNAAYDLATDLTQGLYLSPTRRQTIMERVRAIHEYYGLPFDPRFWTSHAAGSDDYEMRYMFQVLGVLAGNVTGTGLSTTNGPPDWGRSLPIPATLGGPFDLQGCNIVAGDTLAAMEAAVDRMIAAGRFMNFNFYGASSIPTEADFRAFLTCIVAKQTAGLLTIVSPAEFVALATEPVILPPPPPPPANSSPALALARYLDVQSLVDLVEYGGGNIFLETSATEPDDAYTIVTTGGNMPIGSDHLGYDEPTVSIRVRGTDKLATHGRARAVYGALQGLHDVTLDPGDLAVRLHLCRSLNSEPSYMGVDDRGRYEYVLTFSLHVRAATANRS